MKINIINALLGLLVLIDPIVLYGQSAKYFEVSYPTPFPNFEEGWSVQILPDGYLIAGANINAPLNANIHFLKVDSFGNQGWIQSIDDSSTHRSIFASVSVSSSFVFAGLDQNLSNGRFRTLLLKADSSGNIIWQKSIGDSLHDNYVRCVNTTIDGGFILGGNIKESITNYYWENYIIKTDSLGNVEWTQQYNGPNHDEIWSIKQMNDGSYFTGGYTNYILGSGEILLMKLDSLGYLLRDTTYTVPNNLTTIAYDMVNSHESGFIFGGATGSAGTGMRGLIIKTDSSGTIIWTKLLSEFSDGSGAIYPSKVYSLYELPDSSIILTGYLGLSSGIPQPHWHQLLLLKLSKDGIELWRRMYNADSLGNSYGLDIKLTPDDGFIITGRTESPNNSDVHLIKTNCLGFTQGPEANFAVSWNNNNATFVNLSQYADTCIYYFGDGDSSVVLLSDTVPVTHQYTGIGPWQSYLLVFACGEIDTLYQTLFTGISEGSDFYKNTFNIYPNPASDQLLISFKLQYEMDIGSIILSDLSGRIVKREKIKNNQKELIWNVQNLESGCYQISLDINDIKEIQRRLVIIKK